MARSTMPAMALVVALVVVVVVVVALMSPVVEGSQEWQSGGGGRGCLYVSRQKDGQVLVYDTENVDEHGDHFDPVGALDTNPNPTGIATHTQKGLIYVGSYGRGGPTKKQPDRVPVPPTIQIFDALSLKKVGDFITTSPSSPGSGSGSGGGGGGGTAAQLDEEIRRCFPESVIYYQGYLYVSCGVVGRGILKIEPEKKFLKARIAAEEVPMSWGLTTKDNYLYISSHCHEHDDAGEGINDFCDKSKHDAVFRVDLNSDSLKPEVFARAPSDEVGGFGDLVFADDGSLLVMSFHSNAIFRFDGGNGEFLEKIVPNALEYPIGITFRDETAYFVNPGRGEVDSLHMKTRHQDLFAHPGPLLNSRLSYLLWARCPRPKRDEL